MAVGTWALFNKAKKKIGNGTMKLDGAYRMALAKTYPAATLSLLGSITEVGSANGYSSSGKTLASEAWTGLLSAGDATFKFDVADPIFTASGGDVTSIKAAVIFLSAASAGGCHVLARVSLTSTAFTLASGSTLTVQMHTNGVFTLG